MATEIVRWCDVCMTSDERVPGAAHELQLDGRTGTLDLCPDHSKALLAPLLDMLAPSPRKGRPPVEGGALCPVCARSYREDRLAPHMHKAHGMDVAARRAALGVV